MTATQWFEILATYSFHVLILVAVCKLLERALASPADRSAIWNTAFLCVLVLGGAYVLLPRLRLIQFWSGFEPNALLTIGTTQVIVAKSLFVVWCVGVAVSLMQWIFRANVLRRMLRRCEPLPADQFRLLDHLADARWCDRNLPTVLISDEVDGPFCRQVHRPVVVLPRFLLEGRGEDLRHVLLHELEHLNTRHPLQLFWQHVAQVVCWFHPSVWSAGTRASLMREYVCDETAAQQGADSASYLRTLLHIAERFEKKRNRSAIGFVRTPGELALRARRLAELARQPDGTKQSGWLSRRSAACALVGLTCLLYLVCLPLDTLASSRSTWSPWPTWSARSLHCLGLNVRDYEHYDRRTRLFEIAHHHSPPADATPSFASDNAASK